jgi:hypothetical protein
MLAVVLTIAAVGFIAAALFRTATVLPTPMPFETARQPPAG